MTFITFYICLCFLWFFFLSIFFLCLFYISLHLFNLLTTQTFTFVLCWVFFIFLHLPVRYQHELPVAIQERKIKCITHAELCKLMKWKLMVRISANFFLFVRLLTFWNVSRLSQRTVFVLKWDVQFVTKSHRLSWIYVTKASG